MNFTKLFFFFFLSISLNAQVEYDKLFGEKYGIEVLVKTDDVIDLDLLSYEGITLDHGSTNDVCNLYVTQKGLSHLTQKSVVFKFKEVREPQLSMKTYNDILKINKGGACLPEFDFYPTYEAYEQLMYDFESQYPDICKIINIKSLSTGRKLLVAQIGQNLDVQELKPNFLYTSSMHGDELAGYPTMIKLIDHLLCNYGVNDHITHLVNNINIFINPLANPNGTYTNDNSTVSGARRENGSFVDLNRNYPDPDQGENPDNRTYQVETLAFIEFCETYNINLSCNLHGGAEICNYPWDAFSHRHADDSWWEKVCRNYADTVQFYSPDGYLEQFNNGIVFGFDWFEAHGTRQDHMTYFLRGREFTLEMSNQKLLDADALPNMWHYHKNALLNYMEESTFGIKGAIIDCLTGLPLEAEVVIYQHDKDNSSVFSDSLNGFYYRYLDEGNYDVSFTAAGYDTLTYSYNIIDKSILIENIELCPNDLSMSVDNSVKDIKILQLGNKILIDGDLSNDHYKYRMFTNAGKAIQKGSLIDKSIVVNSNISTGIYYLQLYNNNESYVKMLLIK